MPPIIAIQFGSIGRRYHFDAQGITDLQPGDRVVVETSRGKQLGIVTGYVAQDEIGGRSCRPIVRRATPRDLAMQHEFDARALSALVTCRDKAGQVGLKGYKFVKAEYNFDGSQVTIHFTTDRKRPEQTALERELRRTLRTRVELYQIGPRDVAKELDGLGACGLQRCCSRFLTKFDSVSIRMAKVQQISLTPSDVTGLCGRLRCCLAYEHELYAEMSKGLPKRGKDVVTPYGKGRVVEVRTLAELIVVDVNGVRHEVQREDIGKTEFTTPPPAKQVVLPSWTPLFADDDEPERPSPVKQPAPTPEEKPSRSRRSRQRSPRTPKSEQGRQDAPSPSRSPAPADKGSRSRRTSRRRRRPSDKGRQGQQG